MAYKYETHLHTSASSKCGKSTPEEMVQLYKKLGYTGIMVTDHFHKGNTCIDRALPWKQWVDGYCDAYKRAKAEGKKVGLQVFFGWETSYKGEDFLIYGLDDKWLKKHPEIITLDQKGQYELVKKSGGYVFQAHPFRERDYQTEIKIHPTLCDAFEVANAGNNQHEDILAYDYAKAHRIPMTAGSDIHKACRTKNHLVMGVITKKKFRNVKDYCEAVIQGKVELNVPDGWFAQSRDTKPFFTVNEFDSDNIPHVIPKECFEGEKVADAPNLAKKLKAIQESDFFSRIEIIDGKAVLKDE